MSIIIVSVIRQYMGTTTTRIRQGNIISITSKKNTNNCENVSSDLHFSTSAHGLYACHNKQLFIKMMLS